MQPARSSPRARTINELKELIARHVSPANLDSEIALLSAQSAENQSVMAARLEVIERYLQSSSRTMDVADRAAQLMGVKRRQFLRLVAKCAELGPVRALTPRFRNVQRASVRTDGFNSNVEAHLATILAERPDAKLAEIDAYLREHLAPSEYPSGSALRRRVLGLRAARNSTSGRFGDEFIVDQAAIDLAITGGSSSSCLLTLVVDRATRLIIGGSAIPDDKMGIGLRLALNHANDTIARQAQGSALSLAPRIGRISWIAPPGFETASGAIQAAPKQPEFSIETDGARRHGSLLLRTIGDRFGPYTLRTRLTAETRRPVGNQSLRVSQTDADRLVATLTWAWNQEIIDRLPVTGEAGKAGKGRKLRSLVRQFSRFMDPVFEESLRELGIRGLP